MSAAAGGVAAPGAGAGAGRGWLAWVAAVVVAFVALSVLGEALGGGPQGPASSAYATSSHGLAAAAELLSRDGHPVSELRADLSSAPLDPRTTVLVLDPDALLRADGQRLIAFVRAGGRLVIGGSQPAVWLDALPIATPQWSARAPTAYTVGPTIGPAAGATVRTAGDGAWITAGALGVTVGERDGAPPALVLDKRLGAGSLYLLADASPLQNRLLSSGANAALALGLAGPAGRPVVSVESVHGYGAARGLSAVPTRWWVVLAGLAVTGLLWVLARGRRLGPPDPPGFEDPPARRAYVDALALTLRRTGEDRVVAHMLAEHAPTGAAAGDRARDPDDLLGAAAAVSAARRR